MNKKITAVLMVLAVLFASGVLYAQCNCPKQAQCGCGCNSACNTGDKGMMLEKIAKELNLTSDQICQLKKIKSDFMDATKDTRAQLKAEKENLANLWAADTLDADAIKAEFSKIDELKSQLRDTGIDYAAKAMNILTSDQRCKLKTMIKNRMQDCRNMCMGMGFGCIAGCDCDQ